MTNIYLKRNELSENSKWLRSAKFDNKVKRDHGFEMDKEQNKVYKKFDFYNKYIKALNKEKEEIKK